APWRGVASFGLVAMATLFVASPFLIIDHVTVIANLSGEARPLHPGATGGGLFATIGWYVAGPLVSSLGTGGLLLGAAGMVRGGGGRQRWIWVVLPFCFAFLIVIGMQSLRWERWIVPLLPFVALAAGRALCEVIDLLPARAARAIWPAALL